jgi:ferredoxin
LLKSGKISLEPIIARINADACVWCGKCAEVCEYDAIKQGISSLGGMTSQPIAEINKATCIGCGICAPVCPSDAINLIQFTNSEIEAMIDGFMKRIDIKEKEEGQAIEAEELELTEMKEFPQIWKDISASITNEKKTIPQISEELKKDTSLITYHLMTMNKYNIVMADGMDDSEAYYYYKFKN